MSHSEWFNDCSNWNNIQTCGEFDKVFEIIVPQMNAEKQVPENVGSVNQSDKN